ncbi:hypothetical protein Daus18300_005441 [Diaporthe australafricana]|uniref:Uncharacterized protein n=1 Tax=Diaporthe australafricana TaxID=127596 RepID=A0ABR3X1J2_9PEZI
MTEHDTHFSIVLRDDTAIQSVGIDLKALTAQGTNLGGGEQTTSFIDEDFGDNRVTIQGDIVQVVHGTIVEGGSPATLVVFQFAFVPHDNDARFKKAEIFVTFPEGEVRGISPHHTSVTMQSERMEETTKSVSPSLEAAYGPGKIGVGYTWEKKDSMTRRDHAKVTGLIKSFRVEGRKVPNTASWTMIENSQTQTGIPHLIQTAMLVKRGDEFSDEIFIAEVTVKAEVDMFTSMKDKAQRLSKTLAGKAKKGQDVVFNPSVNIGSVENSHCLEDEILDNHKRLLTFPAWVDGADKPQSPKVKGVVEGTTDLEHEFDGSKSKDIQLGDEIDVASTEILVKSKAGAISTDITRDGQCRVTSTEAEIQEQLVLVRAEARLVERLAGLLKEERKLVSDLRQVQRLRNSRDEAAS